MLKQFGMLAVEWLKKSGMLVGFLVGFIVIAIVFKTVESVFDAIPALMTGEPVTSPFGMLGLVMLGSASGHMWGQSSSGAASYGGRFTKAQIVATLIFVALLLLIHRDSLHSWSGFTDIAAEPMFVALVVWLFVVIAPWNAAVASQSNSKGRFGASHDQ